MSKFHESSYQAHSNLYFDLVNEAEIKKYETWFDHKTTDLWRHQRMFDHLNPILNSTPKSQWLTIADGRFGTAARYIESNGGKAKATDLDVRLLAIAKERGWINDFEFANAEALPFEDDSVDYSYCKQSYHHFPRPLLALYEMLRVSKKAVIFTEPADFVPLPPLGANLRRAKRILKSILGKSNPHTDQGNYEPVGNYIYSISEREFEKVALGLNLPCVAFLRYSDAYLSGAEDELYDDNGRIRQYIEKRIAYISWLNKLGLQRHNQITAIIFKVLPDDNTIAQMRFIGYDVRILPRNPHLK